VWSSVKVLQRCIREGLPGEGNVGDIVTAAATAEMRRRFRLGFWARIVELRLAEDGEEIKTETWRSTALLRRSTSAAGVVERSPSRWRPCTRGRRQLSSLAWAPQAGLRSAGYWAVLVGFGLGKFFPFFSVSFFFFYLFCSFWFSNLSSNLFMQIFEQGLTLKKIHLVSYTRYYVV
jgi:hypothetical protein